MRTIRPPALRPASWELPGTLLESTSTWRLYQLTCTLLWRLHKSSTCTLLWRLHNSSTCTSLWRLHKCSTCTSLWRLRISSTRTSLWRLRISSTCTSLWRLHKCTCTSECTLGPHRP
ncbi:hypothetical protein M011DRAFT_58403 [Sporormia fimetaria CBS 119925]|uniref:Uncharacterized protein n=1 Tax=Sporormia fimetaria CBS 119925 TaxID=1340428 RepID=A0A6A6VB87_9PLEO|nr:hypothetical protein M011DRAFT_58403 [Sporormia fimetaria CBS 119925]